MTGSDKKVLVVEDNSVVRNVLSEQLQSLGCEASFVESTERAVEMYADGFSLILMDVSMPDLKGIEAAQQIRRKERSDRRKHTPIVALTAILPRTTCLASGLDDVLAKPTMFDDVKKLVARWTTS